MHQKWTGSSIKILVSPEDSDRRISVNFDHIILYNHKTKTNDTLLVVTQHLVAFSPKNQFIKVSSLLFLIFCRFNHKICNQVVGVVCYG